MNSVRTQSGFSMVELMISVAVGLFMVAAILTAYVSSAQNARVQQAMSEVQEDGRYASIQLLHDIRQSGFGLDTSAAKVQGYALNKQAIDALRDYARQLSGDSGHTPTLAFKRLRSAAVYFPVDNEEGAAYYLATNGAGQLALYRNGGSEGELLEGAAGLEFEFGLDDNNDNVVDRYRFQSQMTNADWGRAQSVRFHLLIQSSQTNITDVAQRLPAPFNNRSATEYCYPSSAQCDRKVDTADRRLYRVFVGTAGMRNAGAML